MCVCVCVYVFQHICQDLLQMVQKQSLSALLADKGPGLICVYGERDRIVAASTGSFLGFDLGTLAGIQQGKPIVPLIASNAALFNPKAARPN